VVRKSHIAYFPGLLSPLDTLQCSRRSSDGFKHFVTVELMDKEEIYIIGTETFQASLYRSQNFLLRPIPRFGSHHTFFSASFQYLTYLGLRISVTITLGSLYIVSSQVEIEIEKPHRILKKELHQMKPPETHSR
jgi:hypothetical protein